MEELSKSTKLILKAYAVQEANDKAIYGREGCEYYINELKECIDIMLKDKENRISALPFSPKI